MNSIAEVQTTKLHDKIQTRTLRAGIIGLGYVGLPLAMEFSRAGVETVGIDVDANKVAVLKQGSSYIQDVGPELIQEYSDQKKFSATTDFSVLKDLDTVNICVPTPLRKSKDPDISYIVSAATEIVRYLHPGMLIILESTTYPGTTEEVILPMLEETGLKVGQDFYLAFSPERVDPGNATYHTRNIPKVVGGVTKVCTELATEFYKLAIDEVHPVTSPRSAEMVKLLENTFRSVNIGLVNELCLMGERLNVDIWEIIDAAATKPFGFMPFYPGPGLGGHCIPIDPHSLAWKAKVNGFNPRFIELASDVNKSMPAFVVQKAQTYLNSQRKSLNGSKILVLGVTYKKNVSDVRESPALDIIDLFEKAGSIVSYLDPFAPKLSFRNRSYESIEVGASQDVFKKQLKECDLAVLISDHDTFDLDLIVEHVPALLDTRNATKKIARFQEKVIKI
jgi:UDP-N-acetyl-D-glucosamine dehydrogenase